ncbi:MAG: hypothetical protein AB7H88_14400 [Vicinamibacterales bacterium]
MSRVTITQVAGAGVQDRETIRQANGVRLVSAEEEGTGINALPDGVYGFTYSPALAAPLFRAFRYRTFEMHRLAGAEAIILGCVTRAEADALATATGPVKVNLFHDRDGDSDVMVMIPYSRIAKHRQYSIRNTAGIELEVTPE